MRTKKLIRIFYKQLISPYFKLAVAHTKRADPLAYQPFSTPFQLFPTPF